MVRGKGENSGSPGILETPEISSKKVEIPKYVYKKYDKILTLILNAFMF